MNHKSTYFLFLFFTSFMFAACGPTPTSAPTQANDKLAEILARGTLVIATDPAYPPFSILAQETPRPQNTKCAPSQYTENQFTGFDAQTGIEIAHRLGVEPCFVTPPWTQVIAGNWGSAWDIHVGSMAITDDRLQVLYFTQPYFVTSVNIFVYKDNLTYQHPADLNGKRIGICAGCSYESYLQKKLRLPGEELSYLIENAQVVAYENEVQALNDLAAGDGVKLDAIISQAAVGLFAIQSGQPIRMLPEPLYFEYECAVVDKANSRDTARFVQQVSDIIQKMHRDGTLSSFSMRWLGTDLTLQAANFDLNSLNQRP